LEEKIITWLVQGIIGALAGAAVYFAKITHSQIRQDINDRKKELSELKAELKVENAVLKTELKADTASLRREIDDMRNKMPFTYVLRDDYIRMMASFEHKLDRALSRSEKSDC
jgi:cell division protein FtsB